MQRLAVLDAQRGLIMIFMAIDHVSMFAAGVHFSEYWGVELPDYGDAWWMFTRVISHLCAPGFFFLMGMGMHFFFVSRRDRGVSNGTIMKHFALRGLLLVVLEVFVVMPTWILGTLDKFLNDNLPDIPVPGAGGSFFFVWGVLASLGVAMMVCGPLMRLSGKATLALAIVLAVVSQAAVPDASRSGEAMGIVMRFLFVAGQEGPIVMNYPVAPWLSVCLFGIAYGHAVRAAPEKTLRLSGVAGVALLLAFALVRAGEGFGTHHAIPGEGLVAFFTLAKYPPSLAYLLLALGANACFLAVILRAQRWLDGPAHVLLVFGRVPLFFYIAHLYLYAFLGQALPGDTHLPGLYAVWVVGLAMLYPACVRYERFKHGKPEDSLWRMF